MPILALVAIVGVADGARDAHGRILEVNSG